MTYKIVVTLAATGSGLLVGFLLGTVVQYKHSCASCIARRLTELGL